MTKITVLTKKQKMIAIIVAVVAIVLVACIWRYVVHMNQIRSQYDAAIGFIADGNYAAGRQELESIETENYKESISLIHLCRSHEAFSKELYPLSVQEFEHVSFRSEVDEAVIPISTYERLLYTKYKEYQEKQAEIQAAAYRERIQNGVPYIGMRESEINNTSLGNASSTIRHNYECINGEQYLANLYDFLNGRNKIFTARCVNSVVTEVWDYRDDEPYVPDRSSSEKDKTDPYNAADYSNEDDFYYDHYDDFFDYYDAEDYWRDHNE